MKFIKDIIDLKKIPKSAAVLCLFYFISLIQLIPIIIFHLDLYHLTDSQTLYLTTFSDFVLLLILVVVYFQTLKEDWKKVKNNFYEILDTGFKYWLIGLIVMIVSNIIIGLFITQAQATNEEGVQALIKSSPFLSIFTVGVLAPIIEELIFRKAFRDIFKDNTLFILASGLIFGGLHVITVLNSYWDLFYIIPYSSLGIAFGYMYVKTDNVFTSMFMHIFHNTVLTILSTVMAVMIL